MALTLQPGPSRFCVGCAHFKVLSEGNQFQGRCLAPRAPPVHPMAEGDQYISGVVPDSSRPYASHIRKNPMQCGPQGEWFEAKAGPARE